MYPRTEVQLCLAHMVRHSLNFVSWKQRKQVAADLPTLYTAATVEPVGTNCTILLGRTAYCMCQTAIGQEESVTAVN